MDLAGRGKLHNARLAPLRVIARTSGIAMIVFGIGITAERALG
jgi:hypothetical protein